MQIAAKRDHTALAIRMIGDGCRILLVRGVEGTPAVLCRWLLNDADPWSLQLDCEGVVGYARQEYIQARMRRLRQPDHSG